MATDEKRVKPAPTRSRGEKGAKRTAQRLANQRIKQLSPERVTLTPHESTRITGFGIQATYKMLNEGKLPSIKVGARFYIPRAALQRFMETCGGAAA